MTITLDLPQELERELADEAARQGLPLSEYALRLLAAGRPAQRMPTTGTELVHYWQDEGIIGSRSDISDSQTHARQLRTQAERQMQE